MHQLFRLVLGQKDLSRAGDLFSLDDSEIEDSLTEALEQIKIISSSSKRRTGRDRLNCPFQLPAQKIAEK
ncbi:ventricular zone expressed PH domain containing 1 [Homo sapiens]|uniref:Ventricular zone expressed PH domain containing 1 n=1 Tax=Homo sapiens TaxID=9606 RepID=F8WBQ3_HUMAN|nr:ventricular zone expressed PH domain containing 1 [Homo sapiens]KAI4032216.1 ventricular zone expressed PH domain containing 1 [Homo sapiens]